MSGRHTTGSGSTSPNKTKPSVTKPSTKGTEIKLETGTNKTYLCAHICAASKAPKIGAIGQKLYQQTVTNAIKAEADLNFGVWAYLAEVGYDMTRKVPMPLMSQDPARMHRPSTFPLGAAKKQISYFGAISGHFIENLSSIALHSLWFTCPKEVFALHCRGSFRITLRIRAQNR